MSSSSSVPFELGRRPEHAIEMLEEVFRLNHRDWDVLVLCSEAPLSPSQCNQSRRESAARLEERGFITYVFRAQKWELTTLGQYTISAVQFLVHEYSPAPKSNCDVIPFPGHSRAE